MPEKVMYGRERLRRGKRFFFQGAKYLKCLNLLLGNDNLKFSRWGGFFTLWGAPTCTPARAPNWLRAWASPNKQELFYRTALPYGLSIKVVHAVPLWAHTVGGFAVRVFAPCSLAGNQLALRNDGPVRNKLESCYFTLTASADPSPSSRPFLKLI